MRLVPLLYSASLILAGVFFKDFNYAIKSSSNENTCIEKNSRHTQAFEHYRNCRHRVKIECFKHFNAYVDLHDDFIDEYEVLMATFGDTHGSRFKNE